MVAIASSSSPEAIAPPLHVLPFELRRNHIVLSAEVGGRLGQLFLDTGSSAVTLDREWAIAAGVTAQDRPVEAIGVGTATVSLAEVPSIRVGTVELFHETVALVPLAGIGAAHGPIHGTLGYSFFQRFAVEIDYPGKALRLWPASQYEYRRDGAIVPVDLTRRVPIATARVDLGAGSAFDARLVFDLGTGAYAAILGPRSLADNRAALEHLLSASQERADGVAGSAMMRTLRVERIDIGALSVATPLVAVAESGGGFFDVTWVEGTIGAPAYVNSVVIVDYARSRIIVEPASRSPAAD